MIIGISGRIGSGKDTLASIIQFISLQKEYPSIWKNKSFEFYLDRNYHSWDSKWENKKFAAKLKQIASILTSNPVEKFEDIDFKNSKMSSEWGDMTYRELLQKLGTEAIRGNIHNEAWVNALFSDYKGEKDLSEKIGTYRDLPLIYPNWIISDVRFPNEFKAIKDRGGIIIRIQREENETKEAHISETALDLFQFDYIVKNYGTIEDLINEAKVFVEKFNL